MHLILKYIFSITLTAMMASCGHRESATSKVNAAPNAKVAVTFDADSAYSFVAQQVAFGPRVPGSKASKECGDWIVEKLRSYGAEDITQQQAQLRAYNGDRLDIRNISASFNPAAQKRILLLAHWDSRPWADQDKDETLRHKPIDGANDGASGVGVILEIARCIAANSPKAGINVLFVDAEDYGARNEDESDDDSWALGSQYWVSAPTLDVSKIRYAILLDMVGGKDAVFHRDYLSQAKCTNVVDKVWAAAQIAGYADRFPDSVSGPIVDDHLYLITAGIPAIDIIEAKNPETGSFNPTWHTHADNIQNIDPNTLKAVGQTLIQLIYTE